MRTYKKCAANKKAVIRRMREFADNAIANECEFPRFYPIEIFGITKPSRSGAFSVNEIVKELRNDSQQPKCRVRI
jgi:hypothetical protein